MSAGVWWRVHRGLPQQGPGSDASTQRALEALRTAGALPERPRVADLGCGSGRATLALARATGVAIAAVDRMPALLAELRAAASREGLAGAILALCGDIARPPLAPKAFDLLWSEGAIYNVGFEAGLRSWRELLRPGAACAVSECTWLADPPDEVRAFWRDVYPQMGDVEQNLARARRAGFEPLTWFALPPADWDAYYAPIEARVAALRDEGAEDAGARATLDDIGREIAIRRRGAESYSYVFYALRRS